MDNLQILGLLNPLCDATTKFLQPMKVSPEDRLEVDLSKNGDAYLLRLLRKHVLSTGEELDDYPTWEAKRFPQRFPESKNLHANYPAVEFSVPLTDVATLLIACAWPSKQCTFVSSDAQAMYTGHLTRFLFHVKSAERQAAFKTSKILADDPKVMSAQELAPYQVCAAQCAIGSNGYGYFMQQGTGKTAVTIARMEYEARRAAMPLKTLVICPNTVRENWRAELDKFCVNRNYKCVVLRGTKMDRIKLFIEAMTAKDVDFVVVVCSYDSAVRTMDVLGTVQWDLSVLDESHYIKSSRTQRWKAAKKIRDHSRARMCLTGTPITQSLLDLYTQLEFLEERLSGFSSFETFRQFHGDWVPLGAGFEKLIGFKNVPLLQERLVRHSFIISKKEALPELPDKLYDIVEVEMTDEQSEIYNRVATEITVEIENELAERTDQLTISNILVKLLRLAQITSGFLAFDGVFDPDTGDEIVAKRIDRFDPNSKLEELVNLLYDSEPTSKVIVWAQWVQNIKTIASRLALEGFKCVTLYGATKDKDESIRAFNQDKQVKVLVGNPASGGVGINLLGQCDEETNCDHIVYFSQGWSAGVRSQSEDRAHRRGVRKPVQITDLCVPDSIDTTIRQRVLAKLQHAAQVQDIREILSKIRK